ncbi:MAG TPA: hypothetical protein VLI46_11370 [Ramlibacter sp.]|nr:hypothetical protein [Ramlibacter sp.]
MRSRTWRRAAAALLAAVPLAFSEGALAQSYCASDGVPAPTALVERFINADCEACWSDAATPQAAKGEVAVDWVLPGSRGEDAPLSAIATRDALERLQATGRKAPDQAEGFTQRAQSHAATLRVAHGLPFSGYMGASIELKPGRGTWTAWLLLVESVPAGMEGSPVARNVVRNALQPAWNNKSPLTKEEQLRRFESRPMSIPAGANPDRLRVIGWIEDARGRIRGIAESRCVPASTKE